SGAAFRESQPRSGHQLLGRAGHENFAGRSEIRDAGGDMDGNSADVVSDGFDLARMESDAHLKAKGRRVLHDRVRAADGASRTVERGQEAVAERLYLMSAEAHELAPDPRLMLCEQLTPAGVADGGGALRGADQVGEHHRGQEPV